MRILISLTIFAALSSFSISAEEKSVLTHGGKYVYQLKEKNLAAKEQQLMQKALLEGAVTSDQKRAVDNYITMSAAERSKLAGEYRELANLPRGGKYASQVQRIKEFKNKAKNIENDTKTTDNKST